MQQRIVQQLGPQMLVSDSSWIPVGFQLDSTHDLLYLQDVEHYLRQQLQQLQYQPPAYSSPYPQLPLGHPSNMVTTDAILRLSDANDVNGLQQQVDTMYRAGENGDRFMLAREVLRLHGSMDNLAGDGRQELTEALAERDGLRLERDTVQAEMDGVYAALRTIL
jgi:hypothetical protein